MAGVTVSTAAPGPLPQLKVGLKAPPPEAVRVTEVPAQTIPSLGVIELSETKIGGAGTGPMVTGNDKLPVKLIVSVAVAVTV